MVTNSRQYSASSGLYFIHFFLLIEFCMGLMNFIAGKESIKKMRHASHTILNKDYPNLFSQSRSLSIFGGSLPSSKTPNHSDILFKLFFAHFLQSQVADSSSFSSVQNCRKAGLGHCPALWINFFFSLLTLPSHRIIFVAVIL